MASGIHRGWKYDATNGRLAAQYDSTEVFDFDANDFAVAVAATFASTLGVTGAITSCGALSGTTIAGSSTAAITGPLTLGTSVACGQDGSVVLNDGKACGNAFTLTVPACVAAWTLTVPGDNGCCGQQLTTNGSGVTSWAAASLGEYKNDLGVLCRHEALETVRNSPVHKFTYDKAKLPHGYWAPDYEMTGIFGEEAPWAMQGKKKSIFSPINATGYVVAALQSVAEKLDDLSERVEALEA